MDAAAFQAAAGVAPGVIAKYILWFIWPIAFVIAVLSVYSGTFSALATGSPARLGIAIFLVFFTFAILTAILP